MDLIWAFPIFLLAISLATVLLTRRTGCNWGPIHVDPSSLWIPTLIIALVYVPYVYRPVRGQVLSVREKEYVEAAVAQGASSVRLMFSEILPNVLTTVIVMLPLMIATTILTEAALSFLSIGVQPPQASWGTIIDDGQELLYSRPWVAIAPGHHDRADRPFAERARRRRPRRARSPREAAAEGLAAMALFIVRRLIGLVVVLFAITVLTFLIFFATPGVDPTRSLAGRNPTPETVAAVSTSSASTARSPSSTC